MNAVIVPQPRRERPTPLPILVGSVALALLIVGSAEVMAQARLAHAVAARPVALEVPACPSATERQP